MYSFAQRDLDFDCRMLRWEAGAIAEDGIWAPHWCHVVHQITGFVPYRPKGAFPHELEELLADCEPWYDRLFENALTDSAPGEISSERIRST